MVTPPVATIEIPHQTPARLVIYGQSQRCGFDADEEIMDIACDMAEQAGEDYPDDVDIDGALERIGDDLHAHLIVRSMADIEIVEAWVKNNNHQAHRVAVFLPELRELFAN